MRTCPPASTADITIIPHDTIRAGHRTPRVAARLAMEVAMKLSKEDLSKTAPLFQHKDSAVLVIKFD